MNYIIGIGVFFLSTFAFKEASGSLSIKKLNIISFSYYLLLFFQIIGGTIIFWGFRNQYLLQKVKNPDSFMIGYALLAYSVIVFPISIYLTNIFAFRTKTKQHYEKYISNETILYKEGYMFHLMCIFLCICLAALVYTCIKIGYVPMFEIVRGRLNFATERIQITTNFKGNIYIKNLVFVTLSPIFCYLSYIYLRLTKKMKWGIIFIVFLMISLIAKTIDFSKAPVVYFLFYFFIIEVLIGKVKNSRKIIPFIVIGFLILMIFYTFVMNYHDGLFSLTNGPMARVLISQVATFFLHIDAFPSRAAYLLGASFNSKFSLLIENAMGIRSGRVVMELYNPSGVASGTAGVMNTFFVGEAYGNWGWAGVLLAPIIIGILFSVVHNLLLRLKKTPINVMLYLEFLIVFTTILEGGFVDFFYNSGLIFTVCILIMLLLMHKCTFPRTSTLFNQRLTKGSKWLN